MTGCSEDIVVFERFAKSIFYKCIPFPLSKFFFCSLSEMSAKHSLHFLYQHLKVNLVLLDVK